MQIHAAWGRRKKMWIHGQQADPGWKYWIYVFYAPENKQESVQKVLSGL